MADPNRTNFERAVKRLEPLLGRLVFVGGSATGLLVTDAAAAGIRPTKDVDAIVDAASYSEYHLLSDQLRSLGFREDTSEDAPLCRWRHEDLIIDLLPTDSSILGFSNRWYLSAMEHAATISIAGHEVRVVDPVHFVATKIEAFLGRGQDDIAASHDLEDIVMVVDGRPELLSEIEQADSTARAFIATEFSRLLSNPTFRETLPGFLLPDAGSQARRSLVESRIRAIVQIGSSRAS